MDRAPRRVAALVLALALPARALAFSIPVGTPIPDDDMPVLGGGHHRLLGSARASVFVFVRTGQDHSLDVLERLARIEKELANKSVHFVAVVSDQEPVEEVRELVRASGIRMTVLVDKADALYGALGVKLHPVVGVVDAQHRLAAYEHFRKINMEARVRAQVLGVLGEMTPLEVANVLTPLSSPVEADGSVKARWDARLARRLLVAKKIEQAIDLARRAVGRAPGLSDAHAVLGEALTAKGDCDAGARELELARRLEDTKPIRLVLAPCPAR